jgi:hypothetical protein
MSGTMWMSSAGWQMLCCSSWILLADFLVPLGKLKTLWDLLPVGMNRRLFASSAVPTCEVAPLSAMADGIELLRTPLFVVMV